MRLPKPQHLPNLPITQRGLPLAHHPRNPHARTLPFQKLGRRHRRRNPIIRRVEHLKAQPIPADTQIADLAQIASVNIAPGVALARGGVGEVGGEVARVLVGFDDVADAQRVDVDGEAAREAARAPLVA